MTSFLDLYNDLQKVSLEDGDLDEISELNGDTFDPHHLDCLLNPEKHEASIKVEDSNCSHEADAVCAGKSLFDSMTFDENGKTIINKEACDSCETYADKCNAKKLLSSKDIIPTLHTVYHSDEPVYAMIAPAFVNQFSGRNITPGKLRTAFKQIGFTGMIEVALFADILTLKEALEFDEKIVDQKDFQLTSCCCPMWIAMIRKVYHDLVPHVPGSVSPMIACGRAIKKLHPDAKTVFIGPCVAKKAEAKEKDVAGAVDHVLTFQEVQDIFDFAGIDLEKLEEDERDHSSRAGRIYATTGGVSEAVQATVQRLNPDRKITVHTASANGVRECKDMLKDIFDGEITKNFYEGMGCINGCVGGPKILISREEGRKNVYDYGNEATYKTPIDNPYVIELLHRLGFDTVESLLEDSDIFTRHFS